MVPLLILVGYIFDNKVVFLQPPLIQAIFKGDLNEIQNILKENIDINYQDEEKRSPLHAAAFKGDANTTDILIQNGARINIKDSKWLTPLHRACKSGNEVIIYNE